MPSIRIFLLVLLALMATSSMATREFTHSSGYGTSVRLVSILMIFWCCGRANLASCPQTLFLANTVLYYYCSSQLSQPHQINFYSLLLSAFVGKKTRTICLALSCSWLLYLFIYYFIHIITERRNKGQSSQAKRATFQIAGRSQGKYGRSYLGT